MFDVPWMNRNVWPATLLVVGSFIGGVKVSEWYWIETKILNQTEELRHSTKIALDEAEKSEAELKKAKSRIEELLVLQNEIVSESEKYARQVALLEQKISETNEEIDRLDTQLKNSESRKRALARELENLSQAVTVDNANESIDRMQSQSSSAQEVVDSEICETCALLDDSTLDGSIFKDVFQNTGN